MDARWIFLLMISGALLAFELFNYSTTEHALMDILGEMQFGAIRWSTLLSIAFCGIDFAGIARLFTPEQGAAEPKEVWYLFGAWLVGAAINAILTWWGVMMALTNHRIQSAGIIDPNLILSAVPVFVALMVWVVRILIVGTLATALDRQLHSGRFAAAARTNYNPALSRPAVGPGFSGTRTSQPPSFARQAAGRSQPAEEEPDGYSNSGMRTRLEPTYHSLSMNGSGNRGGDGRGSLRT